MRERLAIFGNGGYAECVAEAVEGAGAFDIDAMVVTNPDIAPPYGKTRPMILQPDFLADNKRPMVGVVAIGDSFRRQQVVESIQRELPGFRFATIVHPRAIVSPSSHLGEGAVVLAGTIVGALAAIGRHALLFSGSIVEHGSIVGDFVSTAPGVSIGGDVRIGDRTFIGIGASIRHGISVGRDVVVGAGTVVLASTEDNVVLAGIPARVIRARNAGERYL